MNRNYENINKARRENPYENANILSKYFYLWIRDLFKINLNHGFNENDLYLPLKSHECDKLSKKYEILWNDELRNNKNPSLMKILVRGFGRPVIFFGLAVSIIDSTAKYCFLKI